MLLISATVYEFTSSQDTEIELKRSNSSLVRLAQISPLARQISRHEPVWSTDKRRGARKLTAVWIRVRKTRPAITCRSAATHTHTEIREQTARKSLFRKLERQDDDSISCFQTKRCDPIQRGILIKSEREKGRTIKRRPFQHQDSFKGKVCNQYFNQNKKQSFCGVRIRVPVVRRVEGSTVNFGWFLYRKRLTNLAECSFKWRLKTK